MTCTLRLSADDTKLYTAVANPAQVTNLQNNSIHACDCANTWQMIFNVKKYKHTVCILGKNSYQILTTWTLYKSLVMPHLEYASAVWSPYFKKDRVAKETKKFIRATTCIRPRNLYELYEQLYFIPKSTWNSMFPGSEHANVFWNWYQQTFVLVQTWTVLIFLTM